MSAVPSFNVDWFRQLAFARRALPDHPAADVDETGHFERAVFEPVAAC